MHSRRIAFSSMVIGSVVFSLSIYCQSGTAQRIDPSVAGLATATTSGPVEVSVDDVEVNTSASADNGTIRILRSTKKSDVNRFISWAFPVYHAKGTSLLPYIVTAAQAEGGSASWADFSTPKVKPKKDPGEKEGPPQDFTAFISRFGENDLAALDIGLRGPRLTKMQVAEKPLESQVYAVLVARAAKELGLPLPPNFDLADLDSSAAPTGYIQVVCPYAQLPYLAYLMYTLDHSELNQPPGQGGSSGLFYSSFRLHNRKAAEVADLLKKSGIAGSVTVDPQSNTITIQDTDINVQLASHAIQFYDVPVPQVEIALTECEMENGDDSVLGLEWDAWKRALGGNLSAEGAKLTSVARSIL